MSGIVNKFVKLPIEGGKSVRLNPNTVIAIFQRSVDDHTEIVLVNGLTYLCALDPERIVDLFEEDE